ncbi:hypothetical protein Y1Q_0008742 [Alligator mississippiensis]|uniref:Uncharacterized protein n=1 Tax=Alligator mississippiensis TaxID=8496 RepID=A0A151N9R1_ALLMI|nr:hypothetical protein Y1Q_0008742 [Alligator mississippiensis]
MLATSISSIFLNKKVWTPVLQSLHLLLACLNLNLWTLETPGEACLSHWRMRRQKKGEKYCLSLMSAKETQNTDCITKMIASEIPRLASMPGLLFGLSCF